MALLPKQLEYLRNCNHRWNIKVGATGSGKSWMDYAVVIPKRLIALRGQGAAVLLGNTQGTLSRNILDPMREIWGPQLVSSISSDNTAQLFGRRVHILGADNKKHVARLQGMTIEYAYGDEIATWNQDVFQMLKSRLRCEHSFFDGTSNPDNPQNFLKKFLDSDADIYCQTSTIDDGCLPVETVRQLKKEYLGTVYYNRYILGQWTAADGACYPLLAANPSRYIINVAPPIVYANIGVDFGGGTSGHAFQLVGYTYRMAELVVLEEFYCKDALDPGRLENEFTQFSRMCLAKYRVADVFCDSAEQTLINGLRTAAAKSGLGVNIGNAMKKPINDRIRCACRLQAADRFKILRHCTHTIEAYSMAVYDAKKPTEDVRLDNGTSNIDTLDATEYAYEREINDLIERR